MKNQTNEKYQNKKISKRKISEISKLKKVIIILNCTLLVQCEMLPGTFYRSDSTFYVVEPKKQPYFVRKKKKKKMYEKYPIEKRQEF